MGNPVLGSQAAPALGAAAASLRRIIPPGPFAAGHQHHLGVVGAGGGDGGTHRRQHLRGPEARLVDGAMHILAPADGDLARRELPNGPQGRAGAGGVADGDQLVDH